MTVEPTHQADDDLARRVREALRAVEGVAVASVKNGVVTLGGVAPSSAIALASAAIVARVDGVRAVHAEGVAVGQPEPVDADDWPRIDPALLEDVGVVKPVA